MPITTYQSTRHKTPEYLSFSPVWEHQMPPMQISSPLLFFFLRNYSAVKNSFSPILRTTLPAFPYPHQLPHISLLVLSLRYKFAIGDDGREVSNVQWRAEPADHFHSHNLSCLTQGHEGEYTASSSFRFIPDVTISYTQCMSRVCFVEAKRISVGPSAWYGS